MVDESCCVHIIRLFEMLQLLSNTFCLARLESSETFPLFHHSVEMLHGWIIFANDCLFELLKLGCSARVLLTRKQQPNIMKEYSRNVCCFLDFHHILKRMNPIANFFKGGFWSLKMGTLMNKVICMIGSWKGSDEWY